MSETEYTTTYFGYEVKVIYPKEDFPYYRFYVGERYYAGTPNYCVSKRSALKRAWYRAKWLSDGTYNDRYKTMELPKGVIR